MSEAKLTTVSSATGAGPERVVAWPFGRAAPTDPSGSRVAVGPPIQPLPAP